MRRVGVGILSRRKTESKNLLIGWNWERWKRKQ